MIEKSHPECSFNCHGSKQYMDYIFYSPGSMIVKKLLQMPSNRQLCKEVDLPSSLFPSDHIRVQTEFEVFYQKEQVTKTPNEAGKYFIEVTPEYTIKFIDKEEQVDGRKKSPSPRLNRQLKELAMN